MDDASTQPSKARPISLSASGMNTFLQCPLKYRLYRIDQIPQSSSMHLAVGTIVHRVLEWLIGKDPADRRFAHVPQLLDEAYQELIASPDVNGRFAADLDVNGTEQLLVECKNRLRNYMHLESPMQFQFTSRCEVEMTTILPHGVPVTGYIDRLDIFGDKVRILDYKTGRKPGPQYQEDPRRQLQFYGLLYWRMYGVIPSQLQLLYLKDPGNSIQDVTLVETPSEDMLVKMENSVDQLWATLLACGETGEFQPRRNGLCERFCDYHAFCPLFGGIIPEYPGWPGVATAPSVDTSSDVSAP